ncbi:MAG: aminodeoxychorismate lyase [Halieaceae bacterium]|nr:aminodeoxychorismate lyase [Halieaceae bacterium]
MPTQTAIWIDGRPGSELPLPDRGLDFGDGLFETLLFSAGRLMHVERHMQRLENGLERLGFPASLPQITEQVTTVATTLRSLAQVDSALRVTISRGPGPRGYAPPITVRPRIVISVAELGYDWQQQHSPAHLAQASIRWGTQPFLAGIKHLSRIEQVLAARERLAVKADEIVMLDQAGTVVSVSAGNLFLLIGGQLHTPKLDSCGVTGTRRQLVMERLAPALGLHTQESRLSVAQLEAADEVFYSNALVGLRPVCSFGERQWQRHELCQSLHRQYCLHYE